MEETKKIQIVGTNNKYKMKKLINTNREKEIKKRVDSEKWDFEPEYYSAKPQLETIKYLYENNMEHNDNATKIALQQINKKIYGYKQQDTIKKMYDETSFLTIKNVIKKLTECELKCYYCSNEILVIYDISREMKQWSIDRIDNDKGHNDDNFYIACLDCNLKRRRRSDDKFLFTKQLNIIKQD